MKILLYTDLHWSVYSSIIRSNGEKYSSNLENLIKSLNWAESVAEERKCNLIVCLGDFFDRPNLNSQELSALKEIKWSNIPHKFLVGNHEIESNDLIYNSVNALNSIGEVIDKPTMTSGYGYELIYLPYILDSNRQSLRTYVETLKKDYWTNMWTTQEVKSTIILSHNDIKGIRYGQFESKSGFDIDEINECCSLFINGHLHNQTQVNEKILNLGDLTGHNFSEDGFKYSHSLAILDTDTLKVELINNPYAFYFYKLDSLEDILGHRNVFDNNYSIASVKVPLSVSDETRECCKDLFKEFRLNIYNDIIKNAENAVQEEAVKVDHILQFKDFCISNIEQSPALYDELNLI